MIVKVARYFEELEKDGLIDNWTNIVSEQQNLTVIVETSYVARRRLTLSAGISPSSSNLSSLSSLERRCIMVPQTSIHIAAIHQPPQSYDGEKPSPAIH
jgi:hypothetical protein